MNTALTPDNFFAPLGNTKPYLKIAFEGFAGCGKTYTMAQVAIGLHKRIGSTKPIVIFDTERAAKSLKQLFEENAIKAMHKESRSLADLKTAMDFCRAGYSDILLIDSITHIWENFLASYQKKVKHTRLQFEDWGVIKPTWKQEFSEPFVADPYHTLMTGRAGYEYEDEKDENGKRQIYKSGIKMKVEGETAYEPDMLVLMNRFEDVLGAKKEVWREATVIKDRSTIIDGKQFRNPTYAHFAPALDRILEDPIANPPRGEVDASTLIKTEEDKRAWKQRKDIAIECIEGECVKAWPGSTAAAKQSKATAIERSFGTLSWTAITAMGPDLLETGLENLRKYIAEQKAISDIASEATSDAGPFALAEPS